MSTKDKDAHRSTFDEAQGVTVEQIKQMLRELPGRPLTDTTITFDDMPSIVAELQEADEARAGK